MCSRALPCTSPVAAALPTSPVAAALPTRGHWPSPSLPPVATRPPFPPYPWRRALPPDRRPTRHVPRVRYELHMGSTIAPLTSAPNAAVATGSTQLAVGQALHYLPSMDLHAGEPVPIVASHNRTRIHFAHRDMPTPPPRRGLVVQSQWQVSQDGHFNRTCALRSRSNHTNLARRPSRGRHTCTPTPHAHVHPHSTRTRPPPLRM